MNFLNLVPGALGIAGSFLGKQNNKNPADAAMGYYDQIPGTIKPYYDNYIDAGKTSLNSLMGQYQNLINDPGSVMNSIGRGFKESPGYQYRLNQGMNSVNNAAAAGGMLGTPSHQQYAGDMASNMASNEWNSYLQNALGLYGQGLKGQEGINQTGYNASDSLANSLANNLAQQGNLAYSSAQHDNQADSDFFGGLAKGAASMLPFFL